MQMVRPLVLSLAMLVPGSAAAVQGGAYRVLGPEDARTVRVSHPERQARFARSERWLEFTARHGDTWRARWDEATGAAIQVWGSGWPVDEGALAADATAWPLAEDMLFGSGLPLAVGPDGFRRGVIDRSDGVTTVTWRRVHRGLEVVDARVSLRFKHGRFVVAQLDAMPGVSVDPMPGRDADEATRDALRAVEVAARLVGSPELVVLPMPRALDVRYHLAWRVVLEGPGSRAHVFVDANDGRFLRSDEQLRFLEGTVEVEIDDRAPTFGLTTRPLVYAEIEGQEGDADTDGQGVVTLPGGGPQAVTFGADSIHFDIQSATATAEFSGELAEGGRVVGEPAGANATQVRRNRAQADAHVFSHEVRDYCLGINPNFRWAEDRVPVRVNRDTWDSGDQVRCNAWFDADSINFARQGSGCNNTARLQDVVYHEYGHGFHGYNIVQGAGGWGDGSLGEGISDYLTATMNDDPVLAAGFFTGGNQPLRRMDTNARWPEDIDEDPHVTGMIISAALWDTRGALIDQHGRDEGVRLADRYFWHIAMRASDIEDAYVEVLLADDDNGDLNDGSPNQCLIDEAFGAHGLGPGVGPLEPQWRLIHGPSAIFQPAEEALTLYASVALANPLCAEGELGEVTLRWTTDADADLEDFEALTMDPGAAEGAFQVDAPGLPEGTYLRYWVDAVDSDGEPIGRLPRGSVTDPWYGVWVGDPDVAFATDFEDDDGGFEHELLEGNPESEGADDWRWGPPGGRAGDPSEAGSGEKIWGNDITPQSNWNGEYQPNVVNLLRSPRVEVPEAESVHLQFKRWLTVEDGFFDQAEVRVNGEIVWSNFASDESPDGDPAAIHHLDYAWAFRSYDITHLVRDDEVEIEWRMTTDAGLEFGGWNVDDVRVITSPLPVVAGDDDDDDEDDPIGSGFVAQGAGCACNAATTAPAAGLLGLLLLPPLMRRRRR